MFGRRSMVTHHPVTNEPINVRNAVATALNSSVPVVYGAGGLVVRGSETSVVVSSCGRDVVAIDTAWFIAESFYNFYNEAYKLSVTVHNREPHHAVFTLFAGWFVYVQLKLPLEIRFQDIESFESWYEDTDEHPEVITGWKIMLERR